MEGIRRGDWGRKERSVGWKTKPDRGFTHTHTHTHNIYTYTYVRVERIRRRVRRLRYRFWHTRHGASAFLAIIRRLGGLRANLRNFPYITCPLHSSLISKDFSLAVSPSFSLYRCVWPRAKLYISEQVIEKIEIKAVYTDSCISR